MNPRYIEYARAHGLSPFRMMLLDRRRFPGGRMVGFMLWMSARWEEWFKAKGYKRSGPTEHLLSDEDYKDFDAGLARRPVTPCTAKCCCE